MMGMLTLVMALSVPLAASAEGAKTEEGKASTNARPAALYAKITGASKQEWSFSDIDLTYRPNSVLSIGAVEFTLPAGFQATTKDIINGKALKDSYILNNGKLFAFQLVSIYSEVPNIHYNFLIKYFLLQVHIRSAQKIVRSASVPHFMQRIRLILINGQLSSHRQILADAKKKRS